MNVDPNQISIKNNCFFGLSYPLETAKIVFLSVPWDATVSYREGAANGPESILEASYQLDWYDFDLPEAWKVGYSTFPIPGDIRAKSQNTRSVVTEVIAQLEQGKSITDPDLIPALAQVNQASEEVNQWVYEQCVSLLQQGKKIALIGGDHSVPFGYIRALTEHYAQEGMSILHIDAHCDLRDAYEGFTYSHASIMNNVLKLPGIHRLVQVGIRDLCEAEMALITEDSRLVLFDDGQLKQNLFEGLSWQEQCQKIIASLSSKVYISFDIDGLDPALCPNTGTPVPGGLGFNQAIYLMQTLVKSGREIVGLDLCEVAPGEDEWDGNIGARILYKLTNLMHLSTLDS
jgi:agmatinase